MPYSFQTLTQVIQELANRLDDPTMQFWTSAELQVYITESLRAWNAHSNYWRDSFGFSTVANTTFYDFTDQANLPNSLRLLTVTDQQIIEEIEYHLLEPLTSSYPLVWTGSKQFTLDDIINAIQRRRDEILSVTGCRITHSQVTASVGRTTLPDTVLDIRRMAWLPNVQTPVYQNTPLVPGDVYGETAFFLESPAAPLGSPSQYFLNSQPPLTFDTDLQPAVAGNYDLLTVNADPSLSLASASNLPIPDDFTWIIKYGALADLLNRETDAKDVPRAKYCEVRYRMGLALLLQAPALLSAIQVSTSAAMEICAITDQDRYNSGWQSAAPGVPSTILVAGLNMIALDPVPSGSNSISVAVVENAPIPNSGADFVQVGRDDYDAILDEAQHLAAFKEGGEEFAATFSLHQNFMKQAATYNQKLLALGNFSDMMLQISGEQEIVNPRLQSAKAVLGG